MARYTSGWPWRYNGLGSRPDGRQWSEWHIALGSVSPLQSTQKEAFG
jgi:hypothetical protein